MMKYQRFNRAGLENSKGARSYGSLPVECELYSMGEIGTYIATTCGAAPAVPIDRALCHAAIRRALFNETLQKRHYYRHRLTL